VYLEGKNKELFMQFMRKMLRWVPEERQSAGKLLEDPWFDSPANNPLSVLGRSLIIAGLLIKDKYNSIQGLVILLRRLCRRVILIDI